MASALPLPGLWPGPHSVGGFLGFGFFLLGNLLTVGIGFVGCCLLLFVSGWLLGRLRLVGGCVLFLLSASLVSRLLRLCRGGVLWLVIYLSVSVECFLGGRRNCWSVAQMAFTKATISGVTPKLTCTLILKSVFIFVYV